VSIRRAAAAALFVFAATLACAKTLRYASQDDPQTLDPHAANLLTSSRVTMNIYEPLVWRDKAWKPIPWLATSWTQVDERTWRFKLREGVKFHDGSPFTADDVVFSVQRVQAPTSQMRTAVQGVDAARRIDDTTVELTLKEPNPALLQHLTNFRIASRAWCVKNKAEKPQDYKNKEDAFAARNANGTGAFMLREWSPDVRVVLAQNKEWWGHKAGKFESNLTQVVLLPVKSNGTRLAALLSGEVDMVVDPPTQDVQRLKNDPALRVLEGGEMRVQYLAFDTYRDELLYSSVKGRNPFKDLRVRQAVAHAIDAEAIRLKVMRGLSHPTGSIITPLIAGYHPDGDKRLAFDRERAKKLLADAGYAQGFDVTLDCGTIQPAADICQAVAAMLTQVGIRTKPNIVMQSNYFPKIEKYDTSFYLLSWGGGVTSDALYTLNSLLHSVGARGDGDFNMGRWSHPEMDQLIERIKVEAEPARRTEAIRKALVLANRELPLIPIHQPLIPWAMRKNVTAWFSPVNTVYFYRVRVD
jgi:peptide/nickel transport system substrate-binding protein